MLLSNTDLRSFLTRLMVAFASFVAFAWGMLWMVGEQLVMSNRQGAGYLGILLVALLPASYWLLDPIKKLAASMNLAEFDSQLNRALETEDDESGVFQRIGMALKKSIKRGQVEVLLGDSSGGGLRPVVGSEEPRCDIKDASRCMAVRRNQVQRFATSTALDVCPRLVGRAPCSAVCVPIAIGGRAVGVIHATGPQLPDEHSIACLEQVALRAGPRLGSLRVIKSTQQAASVDPLTGLLNRRSFSELAENLFKEGRSFALVMADIDHFKKLNDTYGHETGDRALKAFADAVRSVVRGGDMVARFGGEEFVLVLPELASMDAVGVLERIQRAIPGAVARARCPSFTVSFGVADSEGSERIEELIPAADQALYEAKAAGRDRIHVAMQALAAVQAG